MFCASLKLLSAVALTSRTSTALEIPYTIVYFSTVLGFGLGTLRSAQVLVLSLLKPKDQEVDK